MSRPYHRWRDIRAGKLSSEKLAELERRGAVICVPYHLADAGRAAYFEGDPHEAPDADAE